MFHVFRLYEFEKRINKLLTHHELERVIKIEAEISQNPFTGKPVHFAFLREKRVDGKRLYFLVYEDLELVLMVSVSDKKTQQATIDEIKGSLPEFRKLAERLQNSPDSPDSSGF